MSLTLAANISADAKTITITGTVPASVDVGYTFRLDDEAMIVKGFAAGTGPYHGFGAHTNVNAWVVTRGALGTTKATHTAGATVEAAVDAYVEGSDPFAAATGGGATVLATTIAFDTAGLVDPVSGDGVLLDFTIPANSLVLLLAFATTTFNEAGEFQLGIGPVGGPAAYTPFDSNGLSAGGDVGTYAEQHLMVNTGVASRPRWTVVDAASSVWAAYYSTADAPTAGAALVKAIVIPL